MSVFDRSFLSNILSSSGVTPTDSLLDKVLDYQRLLQVRFQGSRCPPHRNAVIIEIACRQLNLDCPRLRILSKLGLKTAPNDYRVDMVTCEAALSVKRNSQQLVTSLSIKHGADYVKTLKEDCESKLNGYVQSLPEQQKQFVDPDNPMVLGAMLHLVSQGYEVSNSAFSAVITT